MKVALIGDVHANLPALQAVLEDARDRGAEAIWNLSEVQQSKEERGRSDLCEASLGRFDCGSHEARTSRR